MAFDDALADISAALSGQSQQGAQAAPALSIGPDAVLEDLAKTPAQLRSEIAAPTKAGGVVRNTGAGINDFLAGGLGGFKRSSQRGLCRLIGETGQAPLRASSNQASFGAAS